MKRLYLLFTLIFAIVVFFISFSLCYQKTYVMNKIYWEENDKVKYQNEK